MSSGTPYTYAELLRNSNSNNTLTQNACWLGFSKTFTEIISRKPIKSLVEAKVIYRTPGNEGNDDDGEMEGDSDDSDDPDGPVESSNYIVTRGWRKRERPFELPEEAAGHASIDCDRFYTALSVPMDNEIFWKTVSNFSNISWQ
jgi:hypothetical protein